MSFHVKPFEKKFLKKRFSLQISSKPLSPQETEHIKKEKEKKLHESLQTKGEVNILRGEKKLQLQKFFLM
jgi:hypothetical protein